jgi:WD40 repeat protein
MIAIVLGVLIGLGGGLLLWVVAPWLSPPAGTGSAGGGEVLEFKAPGAAGAHTQGVTSMAFSGNGQRAATSGKDQWVRVWDPTSGALVRKLKITPGLAPGVAWAPEGDALWLGCSAMRRGELRRWDLAKDEPGPPRAPIGGALPIVSLTLAPDGAHALTTGGREQEHTGEVLYWDLVNSAAEPRKLKGHTELVYRAAFSPDGHTAASCGRDGELCLWDLDNGVSLHAEKFDEGDLSCVAFSPPDGRLLLFGGAGGALRVWDVKEWKQIGLLETFGQSVLCAAFTPDGRRAVVGVADGTLRVWDVAGRRQITSFTCRKDVEVTAVAVSPDGRFALSGDEAGGVKLWELPP